MEYVGHRLRWWPATKAMTEVTVTPQACHEQHPILHTRGQEGSGGTAEGVSALRGSDPAWLGEERESGAGQQVKEVQVRRRYRCMTWGRTFRVYRDCHKSGGR